MVGQTDLGERAIVHYSGREFLGGGSFGNVSKVQTIFIKDRIARQQSLALKMGTRQNPAYQSYINETAIWKNIAPEKVEDQDVLEFLKTNKPEKAEKYYQDYQTQKKYVRTPESIQKTNDQEYNAQLYLSFLQGDESIPAIPPPYHSVVRLVEGNKQHGILMTVRQGSLERFVEEQTLTSKEKDSVADQLTEGLNWMISKGVVLCDIKPENILVQRDEKGKIKVYFSDFGALSFIPLEYEKEIESGSFEKFEAKEKRHLEGRDVEIPFSLKPSTITPMYITAEDLLQWHSLYESLIGIQKTYQKFKDKRPLPPMYSSALKISLESFNAKYSELKLHIAKTQQFALGASLYKLYTGASPFPSLQKGSRGVTLEIYESFIQNKGEHLALLIDSGCSQERASQILQLLDA